MGAGEPGPHVLLSQASAKGVQRVQNGVTATGQINTEIISLIPPSALVTFIDAATGQDPMPIMAKLPGIREWKLSSVLTPPPCISYALVQATVGVGTVIILYVI